MRLLIAGEGGQRTMLESLIVSLGLSEFVKLLGYIGHRALRNYMGASDAFVLSSIDDSWTCNESFAARADMVLERTKESKRTRGTPALGMRPHSETKKDEG